MAYNVELSKVSGAGTRQTRSVAGQAHPEVPPSTSRQTRPTAQHRRGVARFAASRVLEIPCWRLPAHLQDRRRPLDRSSLRPSQGNLSLVSSLKRPSQSVFRNREEVFPKPRSCRRELVSSDREARPRCPLPATRDGSSAVAGLATFYQDQRRESRPLNPFVLVYTWV
jgi:hypothetical protein